MDVRHTEKGRQGQERVLDLRKKADKARKGCLRHRKRQTRPGRGVRHTEKDKQGQEVVLDAPRKADKARKEC